MIVAPNRLTRSKLSVRVEASERFHRVMALQLGAVTRVSMNQQTANRGGKWDWTVDGR